MARAALAALVAIACAAAPAIGHAGEPRGLIPRSGEFTRRGLALGLGLGAAAIVEAGSLEDINGVGGGPSLRIGTSASDDLIWMLQLDGAGYLFRQGDEDIGTNQFGSLSLFAQVYALRALWLKGGAGLASYRQAVRARVALDDAEQYPGLALHLGGGIDLYQEGPLAIGLELMLTTAVMDGGVIFQTWGGLGVHLY